MNLNENKYDFLDEVVLDNYLFDRSYMNAIFQQNPLYPIESISQFQKLFLEQIEKKQNELNEFNQAIHTDTVTVSIPKWASREEKYYFRKYRFFRELFDNTFIKKNKFLNSLLLRIKRDVLSLVHLCSVFPFIEKFINFDPKPSFTSVYRQLTKVELTEYEKVSSKFSSIISKVLEWYDANLPKKIIEVFDYPNPITEESLISFGCIITSDQFPAKDEIDSLLDTIDETLITRIKEKTPIIVEALNLKKSMFKLIAQYLLKFIFCSSNYDFEPLCKLSLFLPEAKNETVSEFGIPNYLLNDDYSSSETLTIDFVNHNELLRDASQDIYISAFEPTPIDVLFRITKSIVSINKFITNSIKKTDEVLAFIPFDDTFIIFMAVLAVSDLPNFTGLYQFVNNFLDEEILTNEQCFAQSIIKSAYEFYIRKR